MNPTEASVKIVKAVTNALGTELSDKALGPEFVKYVEMWPAQETFSGQSRTDLLKDDPEAFLEITAELIPRAAPVLIERAKEGPLTTEVCSGLEDYLSWLSAVARPRPSLANWMELSNDDRMSFAPTKFC